MSVLNRLWQKAAGFRRLLSETASGVRQDGPLLGYFDAYRWHSLTVCNQFRHYLDWPPFTDPVRIRISGCEHSVWLRPRTTDYDAYRQIFVEREYAGAQATDGEVRFILDCGANVGLASVYFLNLFPQAKILAVEPDSENVAICRRNLEPYGERATVLQGGVWSDRTRLTVVPRDDPGDRWGIQVRPFRAGDPESAAVYAYDIPSLLAYAEVDCVDVLKIDIERSERPLFASSPGRWLPQVRNLVIELHDEDCSQTFFSALEPYEYQLSHRGDLTYCLGLKARAPERVQC